MDEIAQLKARISVLEAFVQSLKAEATIPYDVGEAFKVRLGSVITAGTPTSADNSRSVNEAGSGTYFVTSVQSGTIPFNIDGTTYNILYY